MTPPHIAAQAGHADTAEILIQQKAKTKLTDRESRVALHLAAENGHWPCVETLLRPGHWADPKADIVWKKDGGHFRAFDYVVNRNKVKEVEEFIQILEDTADDGTEFVRGGSPLHVIARHENMDILRLLPDRGWKCDAKYTINATPLHKAVMHNFLRGIEDFDGKTALHIAAPRDKRPDVEYLVQKLGDIETAEISDMYASVIYECILRPEFNSELAEILVSRGLDVKRVTEPHFTALHAAYSKGRIDAVKWLMEKKKQNVNIPGCKHGTTVCVAVESETNAEEEVRLLREKGAYIDFVEENQPTALQRATSKANATLIDLFLNKRANVNLTGGDLDTPLNAAIQEESG
ncbi:hypothetical protein DL764_000943 [Monosporascus ibericus]|uniref:Uncharacterized protein n=1 Tax=Monosporascus ibericus TaxID=155417 RepID=A0A4Q4TU26_9PEZI|nr:hypothetical protein DL764_000943 [Monosporascus ibericus]